MLVFVDVNFSQALTTGLMEEASVTRARSMVITAERLPGESDDKRQDLVSNSEALHALQDTRVDTVDMEAILSCLTMTISVGYLSAIVHMGCLDMMTVGSSLDAF